MVCLVAPLVVDLTTLFSLPGSPRSSPNVPPSQGSPPHPSWGAHGILAVRGTGCPCMEADGPAGFAHPIQCRRSSASRCVAEAVRLRVQSLDVRFAADNLRLETAGGLQVWGLRVWVWG